MKISKIFIYIILSIALFLGAFYACNTYASGYPEGKTMSQCNEEDEKDVLIGGWHLLEPYQFSMLTPAGHKITGMDIDVIKAISHSVGVTIKLEEVDWRQHQIDMQKGSRDIAFGATYTEDRAKFVNFSVPYRFEENSLFTKIGNKKDLEFSNIAEFLTQVRLTNYRLGVTSGFVYADPRINDFIQDNINSDIVFVAANDAENMSAILSGEIDGFLADRIVGASLVISNDAEKKVAERSLDIKTPIHFIFSKHTVPVEIVDKFNDAIKSFVMSSDYKTIVKQYIYPVLLLETINAEWFFIVGVLGTISFAISGVAIAARENSTLFGTFIFALLPSVGGGILRDVMINRSGVVGVFLTPFYIYCIVAVVLIGFWMVRLFNIYGASHKDDKKIYQFWDNVLICSDALGQASFIVTGVVMVVIERMSPLWLWGPFFAFVTANGGGILRDLLRRDRVIICMSGEISAEISLLWGFIFGAFLEYSAHNPTTDKIQLAVAIVVMGAFLTRILVHYLKVSNVHFRFKKLRSS